MCQLGEISFANKIAFNIKIDDVKKRVLEDLESQFKFKVIQKHHEKYNDTFVNKLNNNPHLISVRTNGNPYLLYLTKLNFVNQCIFIDKKIQSGYYYPRMIITKFRFDDDLFEGTLLDGEMVKDKNGNWIFIINDIIGSKGVYLENVNLVKRLNMLYSLLKTQYIMDHYDVCSFQVKKYFTYRELEYIIEEYIPQLKYTCRGIYFKPLFLKFKDILMNFDDSLIQKVMKKKYKSVSSFLLLEDKEKLITNETISTVKRQSSNCSSKSKESEFYIKKTSNPDVYELYDDENKLQGTACISSLKTSKMMRNIFNDKNITDKVLMLCELSEKFNKWMPIEVVI
jgi:hypothetical protein